jgi:hypothetical protein
MGRKGSISGETRRKNKSRETKIKAVECIENDLKSMGVKRWRKKAEDRSVCAITLEETQAVL